SATNKLEGFENGQWGNISAATSGTSTQWTTTGNDIYYNTGNVGIGSATPTRALDVNGTVKGTQIAAGNTNFYDDGSGNMVLGTLGGTVKLSWAQGIAGFTGTGTQSFQISGGTPPTYFNQGTFFGIGTTTPQALLDVRGTGSFSSMIVPRDT